jgi:hypothetical protein
MAIVFEGSSDGGQGWRGVSKWAATQKANLDKKNAANTNKMETMRAGLDMMKMQAKLKQQMAQATTDEEKEKIAKELEEASAGILLRVLWTTAVVDITSTLYETCQMMFYDQNVDKETRKQRAKGVKKLGEIWMDLPEYSEGEDDKKDSKKIYEEAAFAAMLETVQRKDDALHKQTGH